MQLHQLLHTPSLHVNALAWRIPTRAPFTIPVGYLIGQVNVSNQRVGALIYGLGANEPTCIPLATPLIHDILVIFEVMLE